MAELFSAQAKRGFFTPVLEEKLRLEKKLNAEFRRVVQQAFTDLVTYSPQWSGTLAENWYIVTNKFPTARFKKNKLGQMPWELVPAAVGETLRRGDDPAVTNTLERELFKLDSINYNSTVKLVNAAPYASEVEKGIGPDGKPIRDDNKSSGGRVLMIQFVKQKYARKGYRFD